VIVYAIVRIFDKIFIISIIIYQYSSSKNPIVMVNTQHPVVPENVLTTLEAILPNDEYSDDAKIASTCGLLKNNNTTMNDVVKSAISEKRHALVEILLGISSSNNVRFPIKKKVLQEAHRLVNKNKVVGLP
jgi:uncharacterized protein YaaQ